MSAYLDGSDLLDIRQNTQTADFLTVKSLTFYDEVFYWTTGSEVFSEEYVAEENQFYQHSVPVCDANSVVGLNIWHPSAQPVPGG